MDNTSVVDASRSCSILDCDELTLLKKRITYKKYGDINMSEFKRDSLLPRILNESEGSVDGLVSDL